jgi:hypothetical protein
MGVLGVSKHCFRLVGLAAFACIPYVNVFILDVHAARRQAIAA